MKRIFYQKDFISLVVFTTVCIFVIVLFLGFGVFADGFVYISDKYNLTSADILTSDGFTNNNESSDLADSNLKNIYPNKPYSSSYGEISTITEYLDDIYLNDFSLVDYDDSRFIAWSQWNDFLTMDVLPDGSFINSYNTVLELYVPYDSGVTDLYGGVWNLYSNEVDTSHSSHASYDETITIDDVDYYLYQWSLAENWQYIYFCNTPIYSIYNLKTTQTIEDEPQLNYTHAFDFANNGGEDNNESSINNLYFPSSDFKWRFQGPYGKLFDWSSNSSLSGKAEDNLAHGVENMRYSTNWGKGDVDFSAITTDYQEEHAEDFVIRFKFMVWMKYCTPSDAIPYGIGWYSHYIFATNPYTVDVPLDDFIDNGNIKTFSMSDIFSHLDITSTNTDYTGKFSVPVAQLKEEEYLLFDNSTDLGWKIQASAELHPVDANTNEFSGSNTETYNFLTQISKQLDDSLSTNQYPYESDSNDTSSNLTNDDSQTVTSKDGSIQLINNDNDTININSGNADVVDDLYNDLTVSDGSDSLPERFTDLVDQNAWLTITKSVFSYIPNTIWTHVEIFVGVFFTVLGGAFILRIILDLL